MADPRCEVAAEDSHEAWLPPLPAGSHASRHSVPLGRGLRSQRVVLVVNRLCAILLYPLEGWLVIGKGLCGVVVGLTLGAWLVFEDWTRRSR